MVIYSDYKTHSGTTFVRSFDKSVDEDSLIWHRDYNDRSLQVLEGEGWYIQFDNRLPEPLVVGGSYFIQKETYHRIIKGNTSLKLMITEQL